MSNSMTETLLFPSAVCSDVLTEVLRAGAQQLLAQAVQIEAEQWLVARADQVDAQGRRQVVRNGYLPQRQVLTGIGPIPVRQPRIEDRRPAAEREKFDRKILPPYLRRAQSRDEAIPWMDLYGISTHDMAEPLEVLLGPAAKGVSATTVSRLAATCWGTKAMGSSSCATFTTGWVGRRSSKVGSNPRRRTRKFRPKAWGHGGRGGRFQRRRRPSVKRR